MIPLKSSEEIKIMKEGGKISAAALKKALEYIKVGVALSDINKAAEEVIVGLGAIPSFKQVEDYKWATCININEGVVHGVPNSYKLKEGDLVSVDLGAFFKGFHTDLSYTVEVETSKEKKFLETGMKALNEAIKRFEVGNRLGEVSNAIQTIIEGAGYSVSKELVGHGVGRKLHEAPYVPGYGKKSDGPIIKEGMVFAIEVIYQKGRPDIVVDEDGWTIKTADGSLAALYEHTVAATLSGPQILTAF